jgi:hypothetical protein
MLQQRRKRSKQVSQVLRVSFEVLGYAKTAHNILWEGETAAEVKNRKLLAHKGSARASHVPPEPVTSPLVCGHYLNRPVRVSYRDAAAATLPPI